MGVGGGTPLHPESMSSPLSCHPRGVGRKVAETDASIKASITKWGKSKGALLSN